MDPRDDDIQFDFFEDEPPTTEAQGVARAPAAAGRRRLAGCAARAAPPRGLTPVLRLLALLAIVVAALVFFGLLIQSCASTSKHDAYKSYMDKVSTIAHSSEDERHGGRERVDHAGRQDDRASRAR